MIHFRCRLFDSYPHSMETEGQVHYLFAVLVGDSLEDPNVAECADLHCGRYNCFVRHVAARSRSLPARMSDVDSLLGDAGKLCSIQIGHDAEEGLAPGTCHTVAGNNCVQYGHELPARHAALSKTNSVYLRRMHKVPQSFAWWTPHSPQLPTTRWHSRISRPWRRTGSLASPLPYRVLIPPA